MTRLARNPLRLALSVGLALLLSVFSPGSSAGQIDDAAGVPWNFGMQPFGMLSMPELVKPPPPDKKLFLKVTGGFQYDSNAILNAPGTPIPADIGRKDDWRYVLNLCGTWIPFQGARGDVTLNYAFFQSEHAKLTDFNLTQNLAELAGRYRVSENVTLRYSTVFHHLLLGSDLFDYAVMTGPSLIVREGAGLNTTLDLRYRSTQYRNVSIFKTNADRTGSNYGAALTQGIFLPKGALLRIGYAADVDETRTPLWDGVGHKASLEGSLILPHDTLLDLYGEYYRKDYDGIYRSIAAQRSDDSWSAVLTLTTYFQDRYGVSVRGLYNRNISNVASFNISRFITGVLFDVRF